MPENKRRFKVKIANEVYTIIGKAEPDHMAAVVKIVYKQEELLKLKQTKPKE